MTACQCAKHLCTFLNIEIVLGEPLQFFMGAGDGWCVDHEARFVVATGMWNVFDIFLIMDEHSFLFELLCQFGWSTVITGYDKSSVDEEACNGTHANASGSNKINSFDIL